MKIAILGASEAHLPLYLKAKEMGLETYCIAWAEGAYCRDFADHFFDISIVDKEVIADLCLKERIDGIISNAIEESVPTMAYVSEKCGYNGIEYSAALRATNKLEMRERIHETNACQQPVFKIVSSANDLNFVGDYPVIVKPIDGSCSKGVTKVNESTHLRAAIERAFEFSKTNKVLVEQFIDGQEISVESISYHGEHYVLTITDKETTGAPHFVETAHHQPSVLHEDIQKRVKQNVKSILNSLEITNGASHMEFKITNSGEIFFIEVGARGGGDFISYRLVELSTGYDYIKGMINVALNQFETPMVMLKNYVGVYFLCKETEYLQDFIINNHVHSWIVDSHIDNDMPLISVRKSQDRSGYLIYNSPKKISLHGK